MRVKLMSREEIQKELGWTNIMIRNVLGEPDSDTVRRVAGTGQYTRGLYQRERVGSSPDARGSVGGEAMGRDRPRSLPATGWTMRLGDIGDELRITSRAVGKILDLMGFRVSRQVTDEAVAAGCGVRRWDGDRFHIDWHRDRVVDAIREVAERQRNLEVADALAAAVKKRQTAELSETRRREREGAETAGWLDRGAAVAVLSAEVSALLATGPVMTCGGVCDPSP